MKSENEALRADLAMAQNSIGILTSEVAALREAFNKLATASNERCLSG
jgi:hypothetical protein